MSALEKAVGDAVSGCSPAAPPRPAADTRRHRARVAAQWLAESPQGADLLDWTTLGRAPEWMALGGETRRLFVRRVGSVLLAPALRLWIAAAPLAAVRSALGGAWWQQLLQREGWPPMPPQPAWPGDAALDDAGVADLLHGAGAAVLLATLPHGALRHAASQWLAPVAPLLMPAASARGVLALAVQMHVEQGLPAGTLEGQAADCAPAAPPVAADPPRAGAAR